MLEEHPEISVVFAVKNESKHIEEAVLSVATQEGVRHEVIVVDDRSEDDTREKVAALVQQYPNIRLLQNPRRGKVSAFNYGVSTARGEFICLFAGDDVMPPGSLAARYAVVKDEPKNVPVAGVYKIRTLSEDPRFDGQIVPKRKGRGNLSGQSPLMNSRLVECIFPVPETLPNEDTWMELILSYLPGLKVVHSDVICCEWRVHDGNSYNMKAGFDKYKRALSERFVKGYEVFYHRFMHDLPHDIKREIERCIQCNRAYTKGDLWGIVKSGAPWRHRLRMLSTVNPFLFNLRRYWYKTFVGL